MQAKRAALRSQSRQERKFQMEKWKSFFESSGSDIWTVIDRAITIAAMEQPAELRVRRDKYTEKMFCPTSHLTGLCECEEEEEQEDGNASDGHDSDVSGTKMAAAAAAAVNEEDDGDDVEEEEEFGNDVGSNEDRQQPAACSYMDVEALSDEVEEESRRIKEINRLKNRISDPDEYEEYLCEALERLESMQIAFEALKATGIGRPVNNLRKHPSPRVRSIVKRLIRGWKALADEWSKSTRHVTAGAASGGFDVNDDEYGLPSPPLDEDELLAVRTAPLEVNKLVEFIEDDISAGSGEMNRGESSPGDWVNGLYEDAQSPREVHTKTKAGSELDRHKVRKENEANLRGRTEGKDKSSVPSSKGSSAGNSSNGKTSDIKQQKAKLIIDMRQGSNTSRPKPAAAGGLSRPKPTVNGVQKKPDERILNTKPNLTKNYAQEGGSVTEKLAAAKRKLYEGYQQAENAKKQRTVQVMELTELPKSGPKRAKAGPTKPNAQHNNRYNRR